MSYLFQKISDPLTMFSRKELSFRDLEGILVKSSAL